MSTEVKTFANRADQVNYMTTQYQVLPPEPLPSGSTLAFRLSLTTNAVITADWQDGSPYGYTVTAPRQGSTSYNTDNNGDLADCADLASSQVDALFGRPASASRKATVTIP